MEEFEIYNKKGEKTGKVVPNTYKLQENEYRFICHACIFKKDKMLIQKRGIYKKDFPGYWDISCGGGVNVGETSYEAILREAKEELGINLNIDDKYFMRIFYSQGFDDYYILKEDFDIKEITVKKEEVLDVKYASKNEILTMMKEKQFVSYAEGFIDLLFSFSKQRGSYVK